MSFGTSRQEAELLAKQHLPEEEEDLPKAA